MRGRLILFTLTLSTGANAQVAHLRSLIESNDSAAVINEVRRRPGDARDLLGDLIVQAGRARTMDSDSIIRVSYRLASAYSTVWDDSFPITNLARFSRMNEDQRRAKVSADSLRLAGNRAFGSKGVSAAVALWRDAIRRSRAIADTPGVAAATGN